MKSFVHSGGVPRPKRATGNRCHTRVKRWIGLSSSRWQVKPPQAHENLAAKPHLFTNALRTTHSTSLYEKVLYCRDGASKGAALLIILAMVVLLAGMALAYFSRTTTDRQLAQSSYNDSSSDLLARSVLDIVVGSLKQELLNAGAVTRSNIQPQRSGDNASIPNLIRRSVYPDNIRLPGVSSLASAISSGPVDPTNPQRGEITSARWNSHYLIPPGVSFAPPDWVLATPQGPAIAPPPANVIGRYAFAVYDEGGLLDMNLAGFPAWPDNTGCAAPSPTPWLVNIGRKGIVTFADLTALGSFTQPQIDKIVGWRNYATTQQPGSFLPSGNPDFTASCRRPDNYGSYLLYFGDPPFAIESVADLLAASTYPFTSVATQTYPAAAPNITPRTDQAFMNRQQLLKLQSSLGFSQNVLQYMGTFSRERNRAAPDWPHLIEPGEATVLSEGRFNLNNLGLVLPNPCDPTLSVCTVSKGKKKGWQTGKNRNHLIGTVPEIVELFGLFWVKAVVIDTTLKVPGHWTYIYHTGPNPPGDPDPNPNSIICFREGSQQKDFFQILHYALNVGRDQTDRCGGAGEKARTFGIGASLIDQYDSGATCDNTDITGCDLDLSVGSKYRTHTTVIRYGQGAGSSTFAFGMEPNYSVDNANGDDPLNIGGSHPHRPCGGQGGDCAPQGELPAPNPVASTQVISHAFSNVGELGYGIDTSNSAVPPLKFWDSTSNPPSQYPFQDAPVLDFFSYNPISSAYPRAGIVNLYTKNIPVIAAMLKSALKNDRLVSPSTSDLVSQVEATAAATAIVNETQRVLAGTAVPVPAIPQLDLTRAIAGRLANVGANAAGWTSDEQKGTIARALAEMGQTRTWNLFIDVIAQTGKYKPNAPDLTAGNFVVEGEKRYWLHIALGRDLIQSDGTPCPPGGTGCQVDVLGSQLEEVAE
jgi:hypothetical protein